MEGEETEKALDSVSTGRSELVELREFSNKEITNTHEWKKFTTLIFNVLQKLSSEHKAGALSHNLEFWNKIISDL